MKVRATLGEFIPGERVRLADPTPYGGTMQGRSAEAGSEVRIAWHSGDWTFVDLATDGRWSRNPVPMRGTARVAEILFSKEGQSAFTGGKADLVDPLLRGVPK